MNGFIFCDASIIACFEKIFNSKKSYFKIYNFSAVFFKKHLTNSFCIIII